MCEHSRSEIFIRKRNWATNIPTSEIKEELKSNLRAHIIMSEHTWRWTLNHQGMWVDNITISETFHDSYLVLLWCPISRKSIFQHKQTWLLINNKSQHGCVRWALREHLTSPCSDFACGGLEDCHQTKQKYQQISTSTQRKCVIENQASKAYYYG